MLASAVALLRKNPSSSAYVIIGVRASLKNKRCFITYRQYYMYILYGIYYIYVSALLCHMFNFQAIIDDVASC